MRVVGFAGFSGSGKTTLVEQLIPALRFRGFRMAVIKHAHHTFDIDRPGKDTWRHREAGAVEIVAASPKRLVFMREFEQDAVHDVHQLIARLSATPDWVLVEGFKQSSLPKIEVWREASGQPVIYPAQAQVLAIATDSPEVLPEPPARPVLDLNAADDVAAWLVDNASRFEYSPPV